MYRAVDDHEPDFPPIPTENTARRYSELLRPAVVTAAERAKFRTPANMESLDYDLFESYVRTRGAHRPPPPRARARNDDHRAGQCGGHAGEERKVAALGVCRPLGCHILHWYAALGAPRFAALLQPTAVLATRRLHCNDCGVHLWNNGLLSSAQVQRHAKHAGCAARARPGMPAVEADLRAAVLQRIRPTVTPSRSWPLSPSTWPWGSWRLCWLQVRAPRAAATAAVAFTRPLLQSCSQWRAAPASPRSKWC